MIKPITPDEVADHVIPDEVIEGVVIETWDNQVDVEMRRKKAKIINPECLWESNKRNRYR